MESVAWMEHSSFPVYLWVDIWVVLDSWLFWPVTNRAAVSVCVQGFVWMIAFISFISVAGSGFAGSSDGCLTF